MSRTLLIFPPGWNVYAPYLSVPLLAATLRTHGHSVVARDLNIEFYQKVLSPSYMESLRGRVDRRDLADKGLSEEERALIGAAQLAGPILIRTIDAAKAIMRSREGFLDDQSKTWASRTIAHGLNFVSAAYPGLKLNLNTVDFKAYKRTSSGHVLAAIDDLKRNPFIDYYESEISPWLAENDFSLFGFSLTDQTQLIPTMTLAQLIRRDVGEDVPLVLGGNFASRMVEDWDRPHPFFRIVDAIVRSEGENAILGLAEATANGRQDWSAIPNMCFVQDGQLVRTPLKEVDINRLPTPDFDGFPLGDYFSPDIILPLLASRGCAYKCAFCSIAWASNRFRNRPVEAIVRDMQLLTKHYGTRFFTFVDETLDQRLMANLADAILGTDLDVRWYGETRFSPHFTDALAAKMHDAGCRMLQFGLESYNQRVLNRMRKGTRIQDIKRNLTQLLDRKIGFHLFGMIGFPGETAAEAENTLRFVHKMTQVAKLEYGNPYCTNSVGTFSLDRYAPVARSPEKWGVHILPPPLEDDLSFDYRYGVDEGLSPEEAGDLLQRYSGHTEILNAFKAIGRIPLRYMLESMECWEEWNFLRLCYQETPQQARTMVPAPPLGDLADRGGVSGWVLWKRFRRNFLSNFQVRPTWLAFVGCDGRVVDVSVAEHDILERLVKFGEQSMPSTVKGAESLTACLRRLQRLGILHRTAEFPGLEGKGLPLDTGSIILVRSPGIYLISAVRNGAYLLVDVDREEVHQINAAAALVWRLVNGQRSFADIDDSFVAATNGASGALAVDFLETALKKGLVFLQQVPEPSDTKRSRLSSHPGLDLPQGG